MFFPQVLAAKWPWTTWPLLVHSVEDLPHRLFQRELQERVRLLLA